MGILSKPIQWAAKKFLSKDELDEFWYQKYPDGFSIIRNGSNGSPVSPESATRCLAVYACVNLLSSAVAGLPVFLYSRNSANDKLKTLAKEDRLYTVLHSRPNSQQTPNEFLSYVMACRLLHGNAYIYIERDNLGEVVNLWPIPPQCVVPKQDPETGAIYYEVYLGNGKREVYSDSQIIHNKYFSTDGIIGLSPIQQAVNAIGLTIAAEQYGKAFFENGARPGAIISYPSELTKEQKDNIRDSWYGVHGGAFRGGKLGILEYGLTFTQLSVPHEEMQFLELRKFQVADIARLYGVPPHMIGDVERSTSWGTGIEQQGIGFVTYSLKNHITSLEQSFERALLTESELQEYDIEFSVDALLRGDIKTRYQAYATGRQWGWLNADEIRGLENLSPMPDGAGQRYLEPQNMKEAGAEEPEGEPTVEPMPSIEETRNNRMAALLIDELATRSNGRGKQ